MERVCDPSPATVIGSFLSACLMNVGIARPSFGLIRVPWVLKMRTIPVSTPWYVRYAIVNASAKRFASS
jgi:hypothetical protein